MPASAWSRRSTATASPGPERLEASPYDADFDEPGVQRPADEDFWARVRWSVAMRHAAILEEGYLHDVSRWHRLTEDTIDAVRARLTPRAQLAVWPDLSADVDAVLASLPDEGPVEFVWEDENGVISSTTVDESEYGELAARVAGARAATALSLTLDERHPLFTAVLPDSDGVLRARWRTEPTPSDRNWALPRGPARGRGSGRRRPARENHGRRRSTAPDHSLPPTGAPLRRALSGAVIVSGE
ncbi:hypothetical protein ACWGCI_34350 [Streptomyces sp. NPDC054949]